MEEPRKPAKKIAVVIPKYGLVGGGEQYALELTERLAADDRYEIHVFANQWRRHSPRITFHKVMILGFPRFLLTPSFAWFANRAIAQAGMDLIHSHDRIFEADIFTMHGIPHRVWTRDVRKKRLPSLFDLATAWVEAKMVANPRCRYFLAVSELAKSVFLAQYPVGQDRLRVIHPGVDMARFDHPDRLARRPEIRKQLGLAHDDFALLFVSMNFELKGLDQLMAAMARVKQRAPDLNIKLLVVGKGNYRKYHALATSLGLRKSVVFAGVRTEGIEQCYWAADVFAMLSGFDTFGMAVLEAMAASLPVIVSDRVGASDLVRHGENGFVVDRDDIQGIATTLVDVLAEKDHGAVMAGKAWETARACTWEAGASRVKELYEHLLEER